MEKFKTRTSIFHLTAQGIIYKKVIEGVNVQPEDVEEDQEMLVNLAGRKKALVLVNASAFHTMTPEAIDKLMTFASRSRYATAMVSQSLGVRIFVNTVSFKLKKVPFEMFTNEAQAIKWLLNTRRDILKKAKKNTHNAAIATRVHKKPVCRVHIDKNGILIKKIFSGAHVDLKRAILSEKEAHKLAGNKKILALIDQRSSYTITQAAIKFIQSMDSKYRIATALVAPKQWNLNPLSKNVSKAQPIVKMFKDKPSAVKWLLSLNTKKRKSL